MTPEEVKQFDEWIKSVQDGLEERNAPLALRERVKENHEKIRAHLQQQSEREAEIHKWLTEGEGRPMYLAFIEKELKRLEGLNIPPGQKKAYKEHLESLKTDNPIPYPKPIRLWKYRNSRILVGGRIPPSPPVLTPEQEREKRAEARWHAQKGLWSCRRALERANSKERREDTLWVIKIYEEMLERNKEPEEP
jgi:hypothetical protein